MTVSGNEHAHLGAATTILGSHRISGRYNWNYQDVFNPEIRVDLYRTFPLRQKNLMVSDYWVISPRMSNEIRFGFNRVGVIRGPGDGRQPGNPKGGGYVSIAGYLRPDYRISLAASPQAGRASTTSATFKALTR